MVSSRTCRAIVATGRQVINPMVERVVACSSSNRIAHALICQRSADANHTPPACRAIISVYRRFLTIGMPAFRHFLALAPDAAIFRVPPARGHVRTTGRASPSAALSVLPARLVFSCRRSWAGRPAVLRRPVRPARHQHHIYSPDGRVRAGPWPDRSTVGVACLGLAVFPAAGQSARSSRSWRVTSRPGLPTSATMMATDPHWPVPRDLRAVPVAGAARAQTDGRSSRVGIETAREFVSLQTTTENLGNVRVPCVADVGGISQPIP